MSINTYQEQVIVYGGGGGGTGGVGPQGPQGIMGSGFQGPQGIDGTIGLQGSQGIAGVPSTSSSLFYSTPGGNISGATPLTIATFDISSLTTGSYVQLVFPFQQSSLNQTRLVLTIGTTNFSFPSSTTFFTGFFDGTMVAHIKKSNITGSNVTKTTVNVTGGPATFSTDTPIDIKTSGTILASDNTTTSTTTPYVITLTAIKASGTVLLSTGGVSVFAFTP